MALRDFGIVIPIYVTRPTAAGETGDISLAVWIPFLVTLLAVLNAIGWGIIGLVYIFKVGL